jgi:hypothetical protein
MSKRKNQNQEQESKRNSKKQKTEKLHQEQVQYFIADQIEENRKIQHYHWLHFEYGKATLFVPIPDFPWKNEQDETKYDAIKFQFEDVVDTVNNMEIMQNVTSVYDNTENWDIKCKKVSHNEKLKMYYLTFEATLKNHERNKKDFPENALTIAQHICDDVKSVFYYPPTTYDMDKLTFITSQTKNGEEHYGIKVIETDQYCSMSYDQFYNIIKSTIVKNELDQVEKDWKNKKLMLPRVSFRTSDLNLNSMKILRLDVASETINI